MVVLLNANSTYLAMVSSFGRRHFALETIAFNCFLIAINQKLCYVLCLSIVYLWPFQQTQVQKQGNNKDDPLSNLTIKFSKLDDKIDSDQIDNERDEEDEWYGALSPLGPVFHFDIAVKFEEIDARVLFIQHFGYCFILILSSNIDWQQTDLVSYVPIGSFQQQSSNYSCVAIADCHHQWRITLCILMIQTGQFSASQQVSHNFFTIHIACPVQSGAQTGVRIIDIYPILEVYERKHHIFLCCQMKRVQSCFGGQLIIDPVLLDQVFDDIHVSIVGGIEEGSESFGILHVHPCGDFLSLIPVVQLLFIA